MKLFIISALLISTVTFANTLYGDHSGEIVAKVEQMYEMKCTHKKDTIGICFGGDSFGVPGVCFYSKKYNCLNDSGKLKLKIKMKREMQWTNEGHKVVYSTLGTVIRSKYKDHHKEFTVE